ncbi:hypothetical protein [Nocardioides sp.]|uniref:hypothetical protein n=1 Tax=Nocardioides sp. TaxID=35761 RepID=UPI0027223164|nr:hypothetical protein [Nocardioides sp.]MDO9455249.1 hypothetical protein [Nocardioides sp.]
MSRMDQSVFDDVVQYLLEEAQSPRRTDPSPRVMNASWAVWGDPSTLTSYDFDPVLGLPVDADGLPTRAVRQVAHATRVILGLNAGNDMDRGSWSNFHNSMKNNDHLLAAAIHNSPLEGAFMTDLLHTTTSGSVEEVKILVKENPVLVTDGLKRLQELLSMMSPGKKSKPLLICLGVDVFNYLQVGAQMEGKTTKGTKGSGAEWFSHKSFNAVKVWHYSSNNSRRHHNSPTEYRAHLHAVVKQACEAMTVSVPAAPESA